jgi:hypothetical protein
MGRKELAPRQLFFSDDSSGARERATAMESFFLARTARRWPSSLIVGPMEAIPAAIHKDNLMVATATLANPDADSLPLTANQPPARTPRLVLARLDRLPRYSAEQGEFDLSEAACLSEDALWSRLGSWDL